MNINDGFVLKLDKDDCIRQAAALLSVVMKLAASLTPEKAKSGGSLTIEVTAEEADGLLSALEFHSRILTQGGALPEPSEADSESIEAAADRAIRGFRFNAPGGNA